MTDYPIPFSAPMVRGLLREAEVPGTGKTNTRRLAWSNEEDRVLSTEELRQLERKGWQAIDGAGEITTIAKPSPWQKVRPGDRLWVRESYFQVGHWEPIAGAVTRKGGQQKWGFVADRQDVQFEPPVAFATSRNRHYPGVVGWHQRLGRFMPRKYSRLTLIITGTKIERLQDISEADAQAEGAEPILVPPDGGSCPHVEGFEQLWKRLHGAESWDANPDVVALSFKVIRANIDSVEALAA